MHWLALGLALLLALAIIAIGAQYLASPMTATRNFGLPRPEGGTTIAWWLRLKGVRDIASGVIVLAFLAWGEPRAVGLILLIETMVPLGDMLLILAGKGSARSAFGIHGSTALVMILAATLLLVEKP